MVSALRPRLNEAIGRLLPNAPLKAAGSVAGLTLVSIALGSILSLGQNLVLTRILEPAAFGLMAIALSVNAVLLMMTDIGLTTSVIRSDRGEDAPFLRTVWTVSLVRNLLLAAVTMLAGLILTVPSVSASLPEKSLLADPLLPGVVMMMALAIAINGLRSLNASLLERNQKVGRVIAIDVGGQLVSFATTVVLAVNGFGVWSLVWGQIISITAAVAATHLILPGPRMALHFERDHFDELFHFGKWLLLSTFLGLIVTRGDVFYFSGAFDATSFAVYSIAILWSKTMINMVQRLQRATCLPAFSAAARLGDAELAKTYKRLRMIANIIAAAIAITGFFAAELAFDILYPDTYSEAGTFFKLLLLSVLFLPYRLINLVHLARGQSKTYTFVVGAGATYTVIAMPVAFALGGPLAAVAAYAANTSVNAIISVRMADPALGVTWFRELFLPALFVILVAIAFI